MVFYKIYTYKKAIIPQSLIALSIVTILVIALSLVEHATSSSIQLQQSDSTNLTNPEAKELYDDR